MSRHRPYNRRAISQCRACRRLVHTVNNDDLCEDCA